MFQKTYGGKSGQFFNFKDFSETVDLGDGYQHLVARIKTDLTDDRGDSVALDYFELSTEGVPPTTGNQNPNSAEPYELPGWIAQFSFDEGRGALTDSSSLGNRHEATLKGKATRGEGIKGDGIAFPEAGVVEVKNSTNINLKNHDERTVSIWFKADEISEESGRQLIYEEGGGARGLNIYLDEDRLFVGGWNQPKNEGNWPGTWLKTDNVSEDTWHHVSLVLDGKGKLSPNAFRGYLDGEQFGVGSGSELWKHTDGIGVGGVVGSTLFHDGKTRSSGLIGMVDELGVFNKALSADQIGTLADSSLL